MGDSPVQGLDTQGTAMLVQVRVAQQAPTTLLPNTDLLKDSDMTDMVLLITLNE